MKKQCVKCLVCLFIVMGFAAGGYAAEPLEPLTVQLNWMPNVQFAGILLAKDKGWYEAAGIDLTVSFWKEGIFSIEQVLAGKAQIGFAEGTELIEARAKGQNVKAIAVQLQKTPYCLLSKKDRGIDSPEKLKGKKIGIAAQPGILMIKTVLADAGLKYEDITPVESIWELQTLIDDKIDAYTAYMNNQPFAMKESGFETNIIPAFKHGYDFYSDVYFVSDAMDRKQTDLIQKFLEVSFKGYAEAYKNPSETATFVVKNFFPQGSVSQQTESLKVIKHLATLGEGKKYLGWMEEQYWQKGIDTLYNFKQIDKKIPASDVFTMDFLNAVHFGKKQ